MKEIIASALVGLASRLGRFEAHLLRAVSKLGDDAYCAELSRHLSTILTREVSMGQTSRTLSSLRDMGLLEAEQRWPKTPRKNERSRFVYTLTDAGRGVLSALEDSQDSRRSAANAAAVVAN